MDFRDTYFQIALWFSTGSGPPKYFHCKKIVWSSLCWKGLNGLPYFKNFGENHETILFSLVQMEIHAAYMTRALIQACVHTHTHIPSYIDTTLIARAARCKQSVFGCANSTSANQTLLHDNEYKNKPHHTVNHVALPFSQRSYLEVVS